MEAKRREQTINSRPTPEKKSPDLALVRPIESESGGSENKLSTNKHASKNISWVERSVSRASEHFETPHFQAVLRYADLANEDVEAHFRSMDRKQLSEVVEDLKLANQELAQIITDYNKRVNSETLTKPEGYGQAETDAIRLERLHEIAEKIVAEDMLTERYGEAPDRIIQNSDLQKKLSENTEDVAHLDVWLRQSIKTLEEQMQDADDEIHELKKSKNSQSRIATETTRLEAIKSKKNAYITAYFENLLRINRSAPKYQPREYRPNNTPSKPRERKFIDPIPSYNNPISAVEDTVIETMENTRIRNAMADMPSSPIERSPSTDRPDLYLRWQQFIADQFMRKGAYPDPKRMRELIPSIVDIILIEARAQSDDPRRMIEWIENTIDFGHSQSATEEKAFAILHEVFDEAMQEAIGAIKLTEQQKADTHLQTKETVERIYGPLFSLNKPVQYLESFLELQQDILSGTSAREHRPFTTEEREAASLLLQQMAEQAMDHLAAIRAAIEEEKRYTTGIRGRIRGLLNSTARDEAMRNAAVGKENLANWEKTCATIQDSIQISLRQRAA